jgi:hypothetical protein
MSGYACLFKVIEDQNYAEAGERAWLQTPVELGLIFTIFLLHHHRHYFSHVMHSAKHCPSRL